MRRKVALAIAVPVVLAGVLGGLRVHTDLAVAANSSSSAKQVTILSPAVSYLTSAETAMVTAQDPSADAAARTAAEGAVSAAAAALQQARGGADLTALQDRRVGDILDLSQALRDSDADALSPGTYEAQLRQLESGVTQLVTSLVDAQRDPDPQLELLTQTLSGRFSLALEQTLVHTARTGSTGSLELFAELGAESAAIDRLASSLGESEPAVTSLRTANSDRIRTVRTRGTQLGGPEAYAAYDTLSTKLLSGIRSDLAASADSARTRAWTGALITLLALLAAIALALLISRLLLGPIRKVREGALLLAHEVLPLEVARIRAGEDPGELVPIEVSTQEEMGQLARAVDDLHRQAVHLASGEAALRSQVGEMFVTLSRRSTSLINQQLGLIEELERDEEDPRRLESLFRLDHLAARMRRTSDSLLILADAPSRAGAGEEDLTVADALQAATSGVRDYQRVQVGASNPLRISTAAGGDVVHVLTELVDNALSFSPPDSPVSISASTGSDGVRIEIADAGLGMPEESIAELNDVLRTDGSATAETARRMGLFVVSRLAQRHGIAVSLSRNVRRGVTATVLLPLALLPDLAAPVAAPVAAPLEAAPAPVELAVVPAAPIPDELDAEDINSRINASLGLSSPSVSKPSPLPRRQPAAVAIVEPVVEPEVDAGLAPEGEPVVETDPVPVVQPVSHHDDPLSARVFRLPTLAPDAAAATAAPDLLSGPLQQLDDLDEGTIFTSMRSAWLSSGNGDEPWTSNELEAGWSQAAHVAEPAEVVALTDVGLPARRPGARLLPGGVTRPAELTPRDPEAVRARLSAHAAGVRRGRAVTHTEEDAKAGPA